MTSRTDGKSDLSCGRLVISFDVELGFGLKGTDALALGKAERTQQILLELLATLRGFNMPATWAVTWALTHSGPQDAQEFLSDAGKGELWQQILERHPKLVLRSRSYFAPGFVEEVARHPGQELACHTYSHPEWAKGGERLLAHELELCRMRSRALGCSLESLVFPRNRYSQSALRVALQAGYRAFRSDEFVSSSSELAAHAVFIGRVRRFAGAFGWGRSSRSDVYELEGLAAVPGQRFLRLEDPAWLRQRHMDVVRNELEQTAERGGLLHIWCHPENFTSDPGAALSTLRRVLETAEALRARGRLQVLTMGEVARKFR